ncbi:hypothetical protein K435DRAFT_202630 [Dendrothele bispora CBS 962.96]|uniref:F-box domain-containing protein n=1 Tax=Dendrothele bispora (strain CBS 962.96) TaxID=1314807 RepID=A0A4S8MQ00_DENBC|nr:hypothetical protein K435DRAFT_202630 [Dendrothele bispora CBS 962.96]
MYIGCIYKAKLVQEVMCYLHLYPNLRELELDDVFFSHSIMKTLSKALDKFPPPPLHRLDLREISFTDSEHFLSFVGMSHFSAISVLDMDCISYSKGQRKCSNRFCWKNASVKHDPRFGGPSFATSLALRGDYQSAGSPIKDIIHLLGKSITELKLAVCFETGLDFDPHLCPSLRRLSLTYYHIDPSLSLPHLSELTSLNVLTHFSFQISYIDSTITIPLHWRENPNARVEAIQRLHHALTPISHMPSIEEIMVPKLFESLVENRKIGHLVTVAEEDYYL